MALRGVVRERVVDVPVEVLHAPVEVVVCGDQVGEPEKIGLAQCQPRGITEQLSTSPSSGVASTSVSSTAWPETCGHVPVTAMGR